MIHSKLIRLFIIVSAIASGYLFYIYVIRPKVTNPLCITNTNKCLSIEYYKYKNSVVAYVSPTGTSFWYNGDTIYVYGDSTLGRICKNQVDYEPVIIINPKTKEPENYQCVQRIAEIKDIYKKKYNVKAEYIHHTIKDEYMSIFDIFDMFENKQIIKF